MAVLPAIDVWRVLHPHRCATPDCHEQTTRLLVIFAPEHGQRQPERKRRIRERLPLCARCALTRFNVLYEEYADERGVMPR
jgi:hypothetical protein